MPTPAASIASPQRTRSRSYSRTSAESSSSVTAESASRRIVAMSSSDQCRASGPKTHSAPITWPDAAGQGRAQVAAHLAGRHRRQVAHALVGVRVLDDEYVAAGRGDRAQRLAQRALGAHEARGEAATGDDGLHVGEQRDLALGSAEQACGQFREPIQRVGPTVGR